MLHKDHLSLMEFVEKDNKQKDKKKQEEQELLQLRNSNEEQCKAHDRDNNLYKT